MADLVKRAPEPFRTGPYHHEFVHLDVLIGFLQSASRPELGDWFEQDVYMLQAQEFPFDG